MRIRLLALFGAALLGCAPAPVQPPAPNVDPGRKDVPDVATPPPAGPERPEPTTPMAPADAALARGWMPLAATGVPDFLRAHPAWDGRGVLIGILDSGIDAGVPGLQRTPTGSAKLLDLRDFSGEGLVPLTRAVPVGDSVRIGGITLGGMSRVRTLNAAGPYYGGLFRERPLGQLPASDLNGDGDERDSLAVLVTQASDGWIAMVDSDGDGSLLSERPVRDYLHGRDTFGWAQPGQPSPLTVAVNFTIANGVPSLDLFFDTFGHGTHVAGIAAGNDLYGVGGFDGVAPGAQLLGLKIANNAHGSVTVTGSMVRGMDYAIRFARARRLPLVLNMSFGVGNEMEGEARIDRMVDSVLAANPDVAIAISAGNDGPGLSTVGFPGSATRALTVGATFPLAFVDGAPADGRPDPVAYFSSRGGELAKPDIVTPGVAFSSVPRWSTGDERKFGTSMAAPHAAGLLALLRSAAVAEHLSPNARQLKQALMVTARPLVDVTYLDQGTGTPNVGAAWNWLRDGYAVPDVTVFVLGGTAAGFYLPGVRPDSMPTFFVGMEPDSLLASVSLRSDSPWLLSPRVLGEVFRTTSADGKRVIAGRTVRLRYHSRVLAEPGVHVGVVTGWGRDTLAGPLFRLVNTVVVPVPADTIIGPGVLEAGAAERTFFPVQSDRPFAVRISSGNPGPTLLGALFTPGGRPAPDLNISAAGPGAPAEFVVDASEARPGLWEADAVGSFVTEGTATVMIESSPVLIGLVRDTNAVVLALDNVSIGAASLEVGAALIGAERGALVPGAGGREEAVAFAVPSWARELVVDAGLSPMEWSRFTDFAVTVYDEAGRIVGKEPMNYSEVRLTAELPEARAGQTLTLRLTPAVADSTDTRVWNMRVRIRLFAAAPVPLDVVGNEETRKVHLPLGTHAMVRFRLPASPWPLPDGFFPLGQAVVMDGDRRWTREAGLPAPIGPVMR